MCCRQHLQAVVTAACSVQDKVDAACFELRQQLSLSTAANEQVLAAAAAHVRRLQRQREAELAVAAAAQQAEQQAQAAAAERELREQAAVLGEADGQGPADLHPADGTVAAADPSEAAAEEGNAALQAEPAQVQQRQAHGLLLAARAAAEEALTPPPSAAAPREQQGQEQQQPTALAEAAPPSAERSRQHLQERAAHAAQLLRQRLCLLLLPALQKRLPHAPASDTSAWQALQESAGRLSAESAAACGAAICEAAGEGGGSILVPAAASDAAGEAEWITTLAARCVAALGRPRS